jgi:hypothetical protein
MSTREKFKQDVDCMSDDVLNVFLAMWTIIKERDYTPNAETIAALNETEYTSYDSFDDFMKHIDEMDVDDEEV